MADKENPNCFIWSMVMYGYETWTMNEREEKYLERFEVLLCKRVEGIKCTEKKDPDVVEKTKEGRSLNENA